jgi:hypothetical protein
MVVTFVFESNSEFLLTFRMELVFGCWSFSLFALVIVVVVKVFSESQRF